MVIRSNQLCSDASQGSNIALEAGKYECDPTAIAVQDAIVLVDKPEAQTGNNQTAHNFNVQYETVRFCKNTSTFTSCTSLCFDDTRIHFAYYFLHTQQSACSKPVSA